MPARRPARCARPRDSVRRELFNPPRDIPGLAPGFLRPPGGQGQQQSPNQTERTSEQSAEISGNVLLTARPNLQPEWRVLAEADGTVRVEVTALPARYGCLPSPLKGCRARVRRGRQTVAGRSGEFMAGIEIREYCGDFEDLVELARRVWIPQYAGRMWFSLPDAPTLRCWAKGGGCLAAYDGSKIVGSIFSIPYTLRVRSSVLKTGLITGFTVDPSHRRIALPLVERIRKLHEEQGIAFGIGGFASDQTSPSYRFWTRYARAFPQKYHFLFRTGHWFKILAPGALSRAGITAWERLASGTLGHLLRLTPHASDPHVRQCCAGDLEQCSKMLDKASADLDWATVWSAKQLANELDDPASETLVFEQEGSVRGVVRYRRVVTYGRAAICAAAIDLWADDGLTGPQRVRLLSHVCNHLRERDVHVLLALRCAMMPASTFAANLFLPPMAQLHVAALLTRPEFAPAPPKTYSLVLS